MQVKTQIEDLQNYLSDASNMQGGHAAKLFIPESADEIAMIVSEANEHGIAVTLSGARTGTVGGAIPLGGYLISLERLTKLEIDREAKIAVVGSGVILASLQKAVDAEGLFYPPDPTEWSCQIGGTVATNASGARSFKYGSTRDYVRRLQIVLPNGDLADLRRGDAVTNGEELLLRTKSGRDIAVKLPSYERPRVRKNVSGYFNERPLDAIDIFIGSEGTLGVITEIELSLTDKPEGFFSGIVFFDSQANLVAFVDDVRELSFKNRKTLESGSLDATLIEYFDDRALAFISAKFPETPAGMAGAIFFEQETTVATEDKLLDEWNGLLELHGADLERSWFTTNAEDREKMRAFRHTLPVTVNEHIARHGQRKVGTDMAVPDENFASFLRYYKDTLNASGLDYVVFGHIGDGHLHANMLPKNDDEALRARHVYGRCVAQAIMLAGTVSAEHGIGKLKRRYLAAMMGERYLNEMSELKRSLDPNGILGRGNMLDESYLGS